MRVAAIQMNSKPDKAANLETAEKLVRLAASDGAELVVLPEKWNFLGTSDQTSQAAESLDGQSLGLIGRLAGQLGVEIVAGSIVESVGGEKKNYNTSVHFDASGKHKAVYRKIHLFDVEVAGVTYRESEHELPGSELILSRLNDGTGLGLSICYDLRFPELYRVLTLKGAAIFALPAAFTLATTRDHWSVLIRARAIENQVFVLAANQVGRHAAELISGGRSSIVDPWGVVLAQAQDTPGYITADLDLAEQKAVRNKLPVLQGRRPKSYRWPKEQ